VSTAAAAVLSLSEAAWVPARGGAAGGRLGVRRRSVVEEEAATVQVVRPRRVGSETWWANPVRGPYVSDEVVLARASLSRGEARVVEAYARAGPRREVSLEPSRARCAIVTCGGLCPGLNAVVQEVARCLREQYGARSVLGVEGGYAGLAAGRLRELDSRLTYATGGTALGTSRGQQDPARLVDALEEAAIDALFVVGGDGTLRGASAICRELESRARRPRVVCLPKTIDNDIPVIDRSFGFDTAVAAAKSFIDVAVVEATAFPRGLGLVRLMGRDAGFLAAHAALAAPGDVDAVLVPEKAFALDPLLDYLAGKLDANDRAVLVVAEGVNARLRDADGLDEPLPDVGAWLCDRLADRFTGDDKISLKYLDPSYAVRALPSNPADTVLCARLAANACHAAFHGFTDCAVCPLNGDFALVPLHHLVNRTAIVNVAGQVWADLVRSTGQPDFRAAPDDDPAAAQTDLECDDRDFETPSGGCVVTYE